ncbi:src-like-adapter [Scleropages formosus]|uniref:Src like adaptor n=1 Tax=Scleropages formosus TaxID=113540 RepID=A0A8C9QVJ1_SCLFO|nr:src-like-adapter [Scleropages formosus]
MGNAGTSKAAMKESGDGAVCADPLLKDDFTLVVLHDYPSSDTGEPIFRVGEKLQVLSEDESWWQVCSVMTKNKSYIPKNQTGKVYQGWLFEGVGRQNAEELLQLPGHRAGSFLIRESTSEQGTYSLSVLNRCVKHYRIFHLPNGRYYISRQVTFQSLEDLINHYSDSADDLCCTLTTPCLAFNTGVNLSDQPPPVVMRCNFDRKKVKQSELIDQKSPGSPDNSDSAVSFGVRNSIAAYISLMESGPLKQKSSSKKKCKSYMYPGEVNGVANEEESFQQLI